MTYSTSRIPFDDRQGVTVWPNGARMAVLVYVAPEQWQWYDNEPTRAAGTFSAGRNNSPTLSTYSAVTYGYNVGLRRIGGIFKEFDMKTTMWSSGATAEQFPEVLARFVAEGHELGAHGYSQGQVMANLPRDAQEEVIQKSVDLLTSVAGKRPTGWISPGAECSLETVELLAANGFDYHGDLQDDELPYFLHTNGRTMVEIPYRLVGNLNDLSIFTRNVNSVTDGLRVVTDAFDAYYRAAEDRPLLFNYGMHPYISGRPDTSLVLRCLLEHIHSHDDVWVTSYGEIARWWRSTYEGSVDGDRIAV